MGSFGFAEAAVNQSPVLNTVVYQLHASQWVNTESATVNVSVNATVKDVTLAKLQQEIITKLNSLSSGAKWHISNFQLQQNQSGLQTLSWQLSTRLAQTELNTLQTKINKLSKAGCQYKLTNVSFAPSLVENQHALANLRQQIYKKAGQELKAINQDFSKAHYFLHKITFSGGSMIRPAMQNYAIVKVPAAQGPAVGRKVQLYASVVLASKPQS